MKEFFIALALCHTVQADAAEVPNFATDSTDGIIEGGDNDDGGDDGNNQTSPITAFVYQV